MLNYYVITTTTIRNVFKIREKSTNESFDRSIFSFEFAKKKLQFFGIIIFSNKLTL